MVARDDRQVLDPPGTEPGDDLLHLGPDRRLQLQGAAELAVDADHHHRMAFEVRDFERLADLLRQLDPFHLHEPLAADPDGVPLDVDGDPVAHLVLGVVDLGSSRFLLLGLVEDGQGDRVVELPLGGGGELEDRSSRTRLAAMIRPTSGRSRVRVPVLSKRTVSISFISSRARPSLTRMPLLAQRASDESIARGAAIRMPVPKSELSTATAPNGPHRGQADRADGEGRDHGLVGQPLPPCAAS